MGLNVSHDCFDGAYSTFSRFRTELGNQIGINVSEYAGLGGNKSQSSVTHNIRPLLFHSDCDGELTVEESKQVLKGLEELLVEFDPTKFNSKMAMEDFLYRVRNFTEGLNKAIKKNQIVTFG